MMVGGSHTPVKTDIQSASSVIIIVAFGYCNVIKRHMVCSEES